MDFSEIFLFLISLVSFYFFIVIIRNTIQEIRNFRQCSVKATAQIFSWKTEEDSDNPTKCIPIVRYSWQEQSYEMEWVDGAVTRYQKEHSFTGDAMTIFLNPDDPTAIAPKNKLRRLINSIGLGIILCGFSLIFIVAAVGHLVYKIT